MLFILIGSRVFSLTFFGVDGHLWVERLLTGLPGGQLGFLIVVNILVFILAFFLDFFELAFIIVPLVGPAAEHLGIDLIWFGILLGINMQTAFMHPPFGFSLFFLRSVAPKDPYIDRVTGAEIAPITTAQIYWGALPFVVIQVIMIALTISFPGMVTRYKTDQVHVEPGTIQLNAPNFGSGAPDFGGGTPNVGTGNGASGGPNFGTDSGSGSPNPGTGGSGGGPNFGSGNNAAATSPSGGTSGPNFGAGSGSGNSGPNFGQ